MKYYQFKALSNRSRKKAILSVGLLSAFAATTLTLSFMLPAFCLETGDVEPVLMTLQPPVTGNSMVYKLRDDWRSWPTDKTSRVVDSMNFAVGLYNQLGLFPKRVTAAYSPGTPTADGNYNGNIRFGGQISRRVALHELAHVLGVGQHSNWNKFAASGKWTGRYAIAQLQAFDGPDAVLHCDRQHFWPYGLNQETEGSPENFRRHVLMVAAMRRDMEIKGGEVIKGAIGVGTWESQAEFKDIKVTKNGQTLFQSNFAQDQGWRKLTGNWNVVDGVLRQSGDFAGAIAKIGSNDWTDYTLSLKARKLGGKEGFLIIFGSPDDSSKTWWNIGGYGNTRSVLELPDIQASSFDIAVETGRWYDIRVELKGSSVKCYLDNKLVQEGVR